MFTSIGFHFEFVDDDTLISNGRLGIGIDNNKYIYKRKYYERIKIEF